MSCLFWNNKAKDFNLLNIDLKYGFICVWQCLLWVPATLISLIYLIFNPSQLRESVSSWFSEKQSVMHCSRIHKWWWERLLSDLGMLKQIITVLWDGTTEFRSSPNRTCCTWTEIRCVTKGKYSKVFQPDAFSTGGQSQSCISFQLPLRWEINNSFDVYTPASWSET